MAKGGFRPGAGRKKGVPNKASLERQAKVMAEGATPLDVLIDGMRFHHAAAQKFKTENEIGAAMTAMKAAREFAKEAAPYVHPRLAAVEHKGQDGGPIQITIAGTDSGLL